jgi:OPT family oligopeptide transporter
MAIHELTEEQVRTMSLQEKDRWWLTTVFRGNLPQLTLRSGITGMLLGGVLSLTNLYIGAKTGWTMGVGITSVILAYAFFRVLSRVGLASEFTILENNAMQSIATAAGYMTSPMISSMAAYMMVTGWVIPLWHMMAWITALAVLGVLFAFPFKRRFINDEQQPFPEGRAAGVVMDALHHGEGGAALLKAKLLVGSASLAALIKLWQSEGLASWLGKKIGLSLPHIPEMLDEWIYIGGLRAPQINGIPITQLTLRPELDLTMIGAGGLMGIRTGVSLLIGAAINYAIIAPLAITVWHEIPAEKITFRAITTWSLWAGVAMLTVASILSFFAKPQLLIGAFSQWFKRSAVPSASSPEGPGEAGAGAASTESLMKDIELPLWVSAVGIPLLGAVVVWMAWSFFGVHPWLGVVAVLLIFFFCLIAINSTGLTSITPIGAMGKLTQLTFGVLAPGNVRTNLMSASITGEVANHSANLLQDIKPGYMLGAKPRQQAVGHVLGVLAGAAVSVPVFYLLFLGLSPEQTFAAEPHARYAMDTEKFPMVAAVIWKGVADVLTKGIQEIPYMARWATLIALVLGVILEGLRIGSKNRFPLSPVGMGLGFLIPFHTCFAMFLGSFLFWLAEKVWASKESQGNRVIVQNQEPICAGLIAGGALMGILVMLLETLLPKS